MSSISHDSKTPSKVATFLCVSMSVQGGGGGGGGL